ncbi:hypothetical protein F66182_14852, partial [Fusarium sp. NRRL 66182]
HYDHKQYHNQEHNHNIAHNDKYVNHQDHIHNHIINKYLNIRHSVHRRTMHLHSIRCTCAHATGYGHGRCAVVE